MVTMEDHDERKILPLSYPFWSSVQCVRDKNLSKKAVGGTAEKSSLNPLCCSLHQAECEGEMRISQILSCF